MSRQRSDNIKTIDLNTYVEDIVAEFPKAVEFLMNKNIICIRCGAPVWGTIEELFDEAKVEDKISLLKELNDFIQKTDNNK